jgi:hypothetical protein
MGSSVLAGFLRGLFGWPAFFPVSGPILLRVRVLLIGFGSVLETEPLDDVVVCRIESFELLFSKGRLNGEISIFLWKNSLICEFFFKGRVE